MDKEQTTIFVKNLLSSVERENRRLDVLKVISIHLGDGSITVREAVVRMLDFQIASIEYLLNETKRQMESLLETIKE
jgi:hypothetical protein